MIALLIVYCRNHSLNGCCNTGRLSGCHIASSTTADVAANALTITEGCWLLLIPPVRSMDKEPRQC
ncbi:TPA: hypothetical protein RQV65_001835 [Yersinia enterocolitica]|nr:hypothetical protein [Yersinia enterocolitica]